MTKKRKKVIYFLIAIFLFWAVRTIHNAVRDNLRTYALYYAQHLPFSDEKNRILPILIKGGRYIPVPSTEKTSYIFEDHWVPTTRLTVELSENHILSLDANNTKDPYLSVSSTYNDRDVYIYTIDVHSGKVTAFQHYDLKKKVEVDTQLTDERKKEGEAILNQIIQPIIDYQTEPEWNLQWLFNTGYPQK